LHDIGWDHLEGGRTGDSVWASAHWPEQTSHFVLQCYQQALWTGDRAWFDELYPRFKAALEFQARLDQDGDGVPDLWGHDSCTYDTELYPYYGASAYTAGLYLAALRIGHVLAEARGDKTFANVTGHRIAVVRRVMEEELWDDAQGYYHCWRDRSHTTWTGTRRLRALPVFQPGLRGEVEASRSSEGWEVHFTVKRLLSPLTLKEVSAWLPGRVPGKEFDPARARVEVESLDPLAVEVLPSGRVSIAQPLQLEKEGEGFRIAFRYG
jgi:hypothetical protein